MARRFGAEGMKLVLADIERPVLQRAADELAAEGVDVLAVPTDVSVEADVRRWPAPRSSSSATSTSCATTPVSAAAACPSPSCPWSDFEWVLAVNLFGVIHGLAGLPAPPPGQRRRPHREHGVDLRPLPPAPHGPLQRLQGGRRRAQRDAAVRAGGRGQPRRRVGAVPELGAHQHLHVRPQPARALRLRARHRADDADGRRTRPGGASSSPPSHWRPTRSPPRCATRSAPTASTCSRTPRAWPCSRSGPGGSWPARTRRSPQDEERAAS